MEVFPQDVIVGETRAPPTELKNTRLAPWDAPKSVPVIVHGLPWGTELVMPVIVAILPEEGVSKLSQRSFRTVPVTGTPRTSNEPTFDQSTHNVYSNEAAISQRSRYSRLAQRYDSGSITMAPKG